MDIGDILLVGLIGILIGVLLVGVPMDFIDEHGTIFSSERFVRVSAEPVEDLVGYCEERVCEEWDIVNCLSYSKLWRRC